MAQRSGRCCSISTDSWSLAHFGRSHAGRPWSCASCTPQVGHSQTTAISCGCTARTGMGLSHGVRPSGVRGRASESQGAWSSTLRVCIVRSRRSSRIWKVGRYEVCPWRAGYHPCASGRAFLSVPCPRTSHGRGGIPLGTKSTRTGECRVCVVPCSRGFPPKQRVCRPGRLSRLRWLLARSRLARRCLGCLVLRRLWSR